MNFHSDEWITDSVREHYNEALEYFPEDRIVCLVLQGSQNYGLDYEGSDIDTKLIVTPTFKEIAMNHLDGNDEVIVTVWENGSKIETLSFLNEVEEVEVEDVKIKKLNKASDVFDWACEPRYGEVSCMLVDGKRPVKRKVKNDEFGSYIEEKKVKYYI